MSKLIGAQPEFTILVANLRGGSDPSRNVGGNPVKIRTGFRKQHFPVLGRAPNPRTTEAPGCATTKTLVGLLDYTTPPVPVGAGGTVTIISTDFTAPATLVLGEYRLVSGEDFVVAGGTPVVGEDITSTLPDNVIVIWKTAGAGLGEGTILVPTNLPIVPGTVTINWTDGVAASQTDDGAGGFVGADGNPAGSSIDYNTGAITLDTTGNAPDNASTITIDYTGTTPGDVAVNLAAAIDALPGYSAPVPGAAVITVTGPAGPTGNDQEFEAVYGGSIQNFTLAPIDGTLTGGEPFIGPMAILP